LRRFSFCFLFLTWFHGIVVLTYGVEAFFSALVGYLCWLVFRGSHRWIPATGLMLGISAIFPAPPRTAFSTRPVQAAHQVQGERSHCSGARDFYPKWEWILDDE
jgi:hypothetical protein